MLEVGVVRFQHVFEIRWLSLGNCIVALIKNYQPLMAEPGKLCRGSHQELPASDGSAWETVSQLSSRTTSL